MKNNAFIFKVIKTNLKLFVLVGVVAILSAIIFSSPYFIPPKYQSEAILYPMNIEPYSNESATEQMLQMLESNEITQKLTIDFHLYERYKIDTTEQAHKYKLKKQLNDHLSITKTSYESIVIEMTDENPQDAKNMIDTIITEINRIGTEIEQKKAYSEINALQILLDKKEKEINNLLDSIKTYSEKYDLLDYIMQSKEVTAGYMELLARNISGKNYNEAVRLYKNLESHGRKFHDFHHQLNLAREDCEEIKKDYENAYKRLHQTYEFTNVIVSPEVPDKKTYPIRWLIVLISLVSAELITFVLLLFKSENKTA